MIRYMSKLACRFSENPILTPADIRPSQQGMVVEGVLNPGAFQFEGKTWLVLRIAERPEQAAERVSFPVLNASDQVQIMEFKWDDPDLDLSDPRYVRYKDMTYLSTMSHLRLMCSEDGIHFQEPDDRPAIIHGRGYLETFGIEDCRVTCMDEDYYLTFTEVSRNGVGVGLMHTRDWIHMEHEGMIFPPHNKDCALFPERINGRYYSLHRPSGVDLGGNFIWISESKDLKYWGRHQCIMHTRPGKWDSARIGAGGSPRRTAEGWLEIYHGADQNHRYCLGAVLFDLNDPTRVIARSDTPIMEPEMDYEKNGFFGNVVFTNGHVVNGDKLTLYYGASDELVCAATFSVDAILDTLKKT